MLRLQVILLYPPWHLICRRPHPGGVFISLFPLLSIVLLASSPPWTGVSPVAAVSLCPSLLPLVPPRLPALWRPAGLRLGSSPCTDLVSRPDLPGLPVLHFLKILALYVVSFSSSASAPSLTLPCHLLLPFLSSPSSNRSKERKTLSFYLSRLADC